MVLAECGELDNGLTLFLPHFVICKMGLLMLFPRLWWRFAKWVLWPEALCKDLIIVSVSLGYGYHWLTACQGLESPWACLWRSFCTKWGGKTHLNCGQLLSLGSDPILKKEKVEWALPFTPLSFLTVGVMWPAGPHSCHAVSAVMVCPLNCENNLPP